MEPTISHLPLIHQEDASGVCNLEKRALRRQRPAQQYSIIELLIWMALMFTMGLLVGIFA